MHRHLSFSPRDPRPAALTPICGGSVLVLSVSHDHVIHRALAADCPWKNADLHSFRQLDARYVALKVQVGDLPDQASYGQDAVAYLELLLALLLTPPRHPLRERKERDHSHNQNKPEPPVRSSTNHDTLALLDSPSERSRLPMALVGPQARDRNIQ